MCSATDAKLVGQGCACMLAGLSLWVTDRLFEANAEEVISGIGDNGMSVPDAGKWTALAVCIGLQLGWAVRGLLSPPRVRIEAKEASGQPNLEPPTIESAAKKRKDMEQLLSHVQKVCPIASVILRGHLREDLRVNLDP